MNADPRPVDVDEIRHLLESERRLYAAKGFGRNGKPGHSWCLVVVDVTYGFAGHGLDADDEVYPNFCAFGRPEPVNRISALVSRFRGAGTPVVFTTGTMTGIADASRQIGRKQAGLARQPSDAYCLIPELGASADDIVIRKQAPSAFFGTSLVSRLVSERVDTVVLAGCSTSGCVRASAVDAFSYGFDTLVVSDACFDRSRLGHEVALMEMDQKYATVVTLEVVLHLLDEYHQVRA